MLKAQYLTEIVTKLWQNIFFIAKVHCMPNLGFNSIFNSILLQIQILAQGTFTLEMNIHTV